MKVDVFSLCVYISTFGISAFCFYKSECVHNKKQRDIFAFLGIIILSIIAGLRDETVGRDIRVYVSNYFTEFLSVNSISEAFYHVRFTQLEKLYVILVFLCTRVSSNIASILFMLQLLTVLPVYLAAKIWCKRYNTPVYLCMVVYMFCFFNNSLNVMRQSISAAFLFLAYSIFFNRDYAYADESGDALLKRYLNPNLYYKKIWVEVIICLLFAFGIHKSALIGTLLILFATWISRRKNKIFCFILVFLMPILTIKIFSLIGHKIFTSTSLLYYIDVFCLKTEKTSWMLDTYTNTLVFDFLSRFIVTVIVILALYSTKNIKRNRVECIVNQKYICILGFIIYAEIWILYKTLYGGRISLYCDFFLISLIPFVFNKIIKPRYCAKYVMILALFIYWVLIVFGGGLADSNIYRFRF